MVHATALASFADDENVAARARKQTRRRHGIGLQAVARQRRATVGRKLQPNLAVLGGAPRQEFAA
jgi:hypothetical protein